MFEIYKEPEWFLPYVQYTSLILSFLVWFTPLFILRQNIFFEKNIKINFLIILISSFLICLLNYFFNFQNILSIDLVYILLASYIFISSKNKSTKWIHFSLLLLLSLVFTGYTIMNYFLLLSSQSFFNHNDITQYYFLLKKHMSVVFASDVLWQVNFYVNDQMHSVTNHPLYLRIFGVFNQMNCITIITWLLIYKIIIKFHKKTSKHK